MINLIAVAGIDHYIIITTVVMTTIITSMITIMVGSVNAHGHYCCKSKIGWIIAIIVRWIIRHIGW